MLFPYRDNERGAVQAEDLCGQLNISGSIHDPSGPVSRLQFNALAMVAEFGADLIRARTREGMQLAKAKGRCHGKQPKLSKSQEALVVAP